MIAVAVSGFQKHHVRLTKRFVVLQNRRIPRPEIAGEHNPLRLPRVIHNQLDARRAEHVASLGPNRLNAGRDRHGLPIRHGFEAFDDRLGVRGSVKRLQCRLAGAFALAVHALDVLRLDMRGIAQNERRHFNRCLRREYRSGIASLREQWQTSRVVEMSVRNENCVQFANRQLRAVQRVGALAALKQSTVQQHARRFGFNQISRAGDFAA